MLDYHTSRGLNLSCECDFCAVKRQITREIGSAHYLMRMSKTQPVSLRSYLLDEDAISNWIWHLRKAARQHARVELRQLKEK